MQPIQKIYIEDYPPLLQRISRPPSYLSMIGTLPPKKDKYLCIVGSRTPSKYGEEVCRKLISGLVGFPITIVSGLAIGIDSLAHESAMGTGLNTISVPGSGLYSSVLYPQSRYGLAQEIIRKGGTLLSPFSNNQEATNWTFPVRNEVMAGMSHAVLVIEGRAKSGTLITAKYALDFDREVMAVPGSIFSDLSTGPHSLLSDGAQFVTSSIDILEILGFDIHSSAREIKQGKITDLINNETATDMEKKLLTLLQTPRTKDDLLRKMSIDPASLATMIVELELRDLIIDMGEIISLK